MNFVNMDLEVNKNPALGFSCIFMSTTQGNLKGESVVAAILRSCMKVSYCTSGSFPKLAKQARVFFSTKA